MSDTQSKRFELLACSYLGFFPVSHSLDVYHHCGSFRARIDIEVSVVYSD